MGSDRDRSHLRAVADDEGREETADEALARVEQAYARGEIDLEKAKKDIAQTPMGTTFRGLLI